jgi:hypothetical protein
MIDETNSNLKSIKESTETLSKLSDEASKSHRRIDSTLDTMLITSRQLPQEARVYTRMGGKGFN